MDDTLPYKVSYAGEKVKCEKCRHAMKKDSLQIAIMLQSNEDDCQYPTWYDQECFFQTRLPSTEAAFDGFALLRYNHQLAIKKHLGNNAVEDTAKVKDFSINCSKIDCTDLCIDCGRRFRGQEMRIMRVMDVTEADENQNDETKSGKACWYHVPCFVRQRSEIGWLRPGDLLPGFKRLSPKNKEIIQNQIPEMREIENADGNSIDLEKKIEIQNGEYFKIYDYIEKNVPKEDQLEILNHNRQTVPETDEQILHHLTDVIYFGSLPLCGSCKKGKLQFCNWTYKCTHGLTWSPCENVNDPKRKLTKIPPELLKKYEFLVQQCSVGTRALHSFKFVDEQGNDLVYAPYKKPPLFNMEFVLVGNFTKPKNDIERLIKKGGGKVGIEVHDRVAAIISNANEAQAMGTQMVEARNRSIQVVSEEFLDEIQTPNADPILYIISKSICDWGGDPYARIKQNDVPSRRNSIFYTKSMPEIITLKWKDGSAVDPECGLDENAHVYSATINGRKVHYSVILGFVDIERNKNSYHRMQLLQSNDQNLFWVFESWGRIGTVISSKHLSTFGKLDEAIAKFDLVYKDKTANNFGNKTFQKRPNKFYHLDVEVGMPKRVSNSTKFVPTKLDASVFGLMQMMFDISKMESMMCKCDLDLKQMPLGKISAKQIRSAMSTLKNLERLIEHNGSVHDIRDATNKFYTLIPHSFGVKCVPIIDTIEVVSAKNEMLESLLNMETVYSFLEGENGEENHPLDACYRKLNAEIVSISKDSDEFKQFHAMVQNTHGPTHNAYTLDVLEVFKVVRAGEDGRFQQQLDNHQLLWHGSRLMNFANILANGLKIAPPEAPANGYMFGKGIYFADMVSKSANYCHITDPFHNNNGLMLLCEVALGKSKVLTEAFNVVDIPNDEFQSIHGQGHYVPLNYQYIDGILAPLQGLASNILAKRLHYNEFIVYDPAQVKIKYLFKMKFNFKPLK